MSNRQVALLCALLLMWSSNSSAQPGVADQAAVVPSGSVVVVKTLDKRTLTGRIGALTESGFELQHGKDNSIVTEKLAFADVKSIKPKHGMSTGVKVAIGMAIGAAALFAVLGIAVAASGY